MIEIKQRIIIIFAVIIVTVLTESAAAIFFMSSFELNRFILWAMLLTLLIAPFIFLIVKDKKKIREKVKKNKEYEASLDYPSTLCPSSLTSGDSRTAIDYWKDTFTNASILTFLVGGVVFVQIYGFLGLAHEYFVPSAEFKMENIIVNNFECSPHTDSFPKCTIEAATDSGEQIWVKLPVSAEEVLISGRLVLEYKYSIFGKSITNYEEL